jgi:hypothetical protein
VDIASFRLHNAKVAMRPDMVEPREVRRVVAGSGGCGDGRTGVGRVVVAPEEARHVNECRCGNKLARRSGGHGCPYAAGRAGVIYGDWHPE